MGDALAAQAPYAGANRIRFQGTLSAWQRQAPPLQWLVSHQSAAVATPVAQAAACRASSRARPGRLANQSAWPSRNVWYATSALAGEPVTPWKYSTSER